MAEGFWREADMLFKETDKIGNVFIAKIVGNLVYLAGGSEQLSFGF